MLAGCKRFLSRLAFLTHASSLCASVDYDEASFKQQIRSQPFWFFHFASIMRLTAALAATSLFSANCFVLNRFSRSLVEVHLEDCQPRRSKDFTPTTTDIAMVRLVLSPTTLRPQLGAASLRVETIGGGSRAQSQAKDIDRDMSLEECKVRLEHIAHAAGRLIRQYTQHWRPIAVIGIANMVTGHEFKLGYRAQLLGLQIVCLRSSLPTSLELESDRTSRETRMFFLASTHFDLKNMEVEPAQLLTQCWH
ncbi:unnamed protein product [Somion occarium]|uniref:Uncharacterized protein n=1 Tax=Somion occarium TaxID=3059160 RepID=A0ABP1E2N8_9APHY